MKNKMFSKPIYLLIVIIWTTFLFSINYFYYLNYNNVFYSVFILLMIIWLGGIIGFVIAMRINLKLIVVKQDATLQVENLKKRINDEVRNKTEKLEQSIQSYKNEIGDRKVIEKRLIQSELRYRNIIEHSSNLFYSHTVNHNLTYLSSQTEKYFDCTQDEAKVRWTNFISDNPINNIGFKLTQAAIVTGEVQVPFELELVSKKGRKLWVEVHETPVLEDGETVAIVGALIDITNWKNTSKELKQSETKYRELFENAPDGIVKLDKAGYIQQCNKAFGDLLNYNIEELLGMHFSRTMTSFHKKLFNEQSVLIIKNGSLPIEEVSLVNKSGNIVKVRKSANAIYDNSGCFNGTIVYTHDVTEFLKLRESLEESEKVLKHSQKIAGIGSFKFEKENLIWHGSDVLYEILGINDNYPNSIISLIKLVHPFDIKKLRSSIKHAISSNEKRFQLEQQIIAHKGNVIRWVSLVGEIELDEKGQLKSITGSLQDITRKYLDDLKIKEREEQLSTLINASPDIICFKDGDGKWLLANETDLELFQLKGVDYLGKSDKDLAVFSDFYHDIFLACIDSDEIAWNLKSPSQGIEIIPTPTGIERVFNIIKVPLFNDDGSRKGLVVVGRDISRRTELESELIKSKNLEAVGLMASRLAHEFKNILQSITGYSHFAQKGLLKEDIRYQDIEQVIKAASRANVVVKNLLRASTKFDLTLMKNNIHDILYQFVKSNMKSFGDEIILSYFPSKDINNIVLNCDAVHLELVILNICLNAVDAMPNGGSIKIETQLSTFTKEKIKFYGWVKSNKFYTISVEDQGVGMRKSTLESLFEPFFTTKSIEKGCGLGLSSAFDIVRSHGGFIDVKSQLGKGSVFFIHIPLFV